MSTARSPRVQALLTAAVEVISEEGLRGLTHRAVDGQAKVPAGSTSYYFRTRQALLAGVIAFIAEQEVADIEAAAASKELAEAPPVRQIADRFAGVLAHWLGPQRDRTRARLEIILVTARHPEGSAGELGTELLRARESFVGQARMLATTLGSPDPEEGGRIVVAFAEGLTYDGVTRPSPGSADRAALRQTLERVLLTLAQ